MRYEYFKIDLYYSLISKYCTNKKHNTKDIIKLKENSNFVKY